MKRPSVFAVFCLLVLGTFTYAKYYGLQLFGGAPTSQSASGPGGRGSGGSFGSHK